MVLMYIPFVSHTDRVSDETVCLLLGTELGLSSWHFEPGKLIADTGL